jgi:4a-hydroxytetrahydrobiopterin dehydratase
MPALLTENQIRDALRDLPGWIWKDGAFQKRFTFPTYMDGVRFVEALAIEAEARDHHPDIVLKYQEVTVFLSTHSARGVTQRDADAAKAVEKVLTSGLF